MAEIFFENCVAPLEVGDAPIFDGFGMLSVGETPGKVVRAGVPADAYVQLSELENNGLSGCTVDWKSTAARDRYQIDGERLIVSLENWAQNAESEGRYVRLTPCGGEEFDWSLTMDNLYERAPHLRLAMIHKAENDFYFLIAAETPDRERGDGC